MEVRFTDSSVIRSLFKDSLTGKDGESYDVGRIAAMLGTITYVGISVHIAWNLTAGQMFPFQDYGIGFGAMATGVGVLLKLKENTEPPATPNVPTK